MLPRAQMSYLFGEVDSILYIPFDFKDENCITETGNLPLVT